MAISSDLFMGEDCQVYLLRKGDTGSVLHGGRVTNFSESGFERGYETNRTFGGYLTDLKSIGNGVVTFDVLLDVDSADDIDMFYGFVGSFTNVSTGINKFFLDENPNLYKIKLELVRFDQDYPANPNTGIGTNDRIIRLLYYDAYGISFTKGTSNTEFGTGTFTFNVSPFNPLGSENQIILTKDSGATVANLDTQEGTLDTERGY